jgi:protein TIF31
MKNFRVLEKCHLRANWRELNAHGEFFLENGVDARFVVFRCAYLLSPVTFRLIHKVMTDFGEASLLGVKGICEGQIAPMNPNEPTRSHVYLYNNIFFSRAIDSGIETFKVTTGDKCARKGASRDAQCVGHLHRLDVSDLHTLATVLIDYLGTRFVCQSIVPGILTGEKTHTLLYGAVEATWPLAWNEDMHNLLEESIGKAFMIATRPLPTKPLTDERRELVEKMKVAIPFLPAEKEQKEEEEDLPLTRNVCGPIEAKGIQGSDKRKYVLDFTRLTPRDANWVPLSEGGTGKWEAVLKEDSSSTNGKKKHLVPETLDDDEWTVAVLRPELVTSYTHKKMAEYLKEKKKSEDESKDQEDAAAKKDSTKDKPDSGSGSDATDAKAESATKDEKPAPTTKELTEEDKEHLKKMRLNVNLFLPNVKPITDVDPSCESQIEEDMERVREVSSYLWDTLLPKVTQEIREGANQQNQIDGASLTDMLHQRGINCRYLGRLASLAAAQEQKDREDDAAQKRRQHGSLPRKRMPLSWLEMLECEMVARAAKHVLDSYLTENGGVAAAQPAQTVASFLSALVSVSEETAGETETRLNKEEEESMPDEDDFNALTVFDVGGEGDAVPTPIRSRTEVWNDIEREVGRRFRYTLSLYNQSGGCDRALYIPLLRRVCQRTGVRLAAEMYAVGEKCLCSTSNASGGRITPSYPISPLDIVEIVPLVKHAAAHGGEGFVPCSITPGTILPSLHIVLPDAKLALENAHMHYGARLLPQALELAQQATQLYQRVTDSPMHVNILRCLDLTSAVLYEAGEHQLAADNASRALALAVQMGGFDSAEALSCHTTMSHFCMSSGDFVGGVKHLRAAMYLMELLAGPRYSELSSCYSKLGTVYYQMKQNETALRFLQEASRRFSSDRLTEGMLANSTSSVLASLGQYKAAVDAEKRAYQFYAGLLGEEHDFTKRSDANLKVSRGVYSRYVHLVRSN